MAKLIEVTIDRKKWLHGEGTTKSKLLRKSDGKMCCIGFTCLAVGLKPQNIMEKRAITRFPTPDDIAIPKTYPKSKIILSLLAEAYATNDRITYSSEQAREEDIVYILAKIGFKATFTGEY